MSDRQEFEHANEKHQRRGNTRYKLGIVLIILSSLGILGAVYSVVYTGEGLLQFTLLLAPLLIGSYLYTTGDKMRKPLNYLHWLHDQRWLKQHRPKK